MAFTSLASTIIRRFQPVPTGGRYHTSFAAVLRVRVARARSDWVCNTALECGHDCGKDRVVPRSRTAKLRCTWIVAERTVARDRRRRLTTVLERDGLGVSGGPYHLE